MSVQVDDEMLMAAADGELDAAQTAEILRLAESNPAIAARLARFRRSREVVAAAFEPLKSAPVPDRLVSTVIGDGAQSGHRLTWVLPIAAALVGLGVAMGLLLPNVFFPPDRSGVDLLAAAAAVEWGTELAQTPTGGEMAVSTGGRVIEARVTGTYPTQRGDCRSFVASSDASRVDGMVCVDGFGWQTVLLMPAGREGYATASDAAAGAIDALLDSFGAEAPREPVDEAQRISEGWR